MGGGIVSAKLCISVKIVIIVAISSNFTVYFKDSIGLKCKMGALT